MNVGPGNKAYYSHISMGNIAQKNMNKSTVNSDIFEKWFKFEKCFNYLK